MTDFGPLVQSLQEELATFYASESLDESTRLTVATNSTLVERRAGLLVSVLSEHGGVEDLAGKRVLDLGCGFGALSVYFAARGAQVVGVDPHDERLEVGSRVARRHGLAVDLRRGRMERLRLEESSFDLAVANNSLCYLVERERRQKALSEVMRVLKPAGTFIVRNPNRWNPIDQFTGWPLIHLMPPDVTTAVAQRAGRKRSRCRLTSPLEARRELRRAGFARVTQAGYVEESHRSDLLKPFARYQHFIARA